MDERKQANRKRRSMKKTVEGGKNKDDETPEEGRESGGEPSAVSSREKRSRDQWVICPRWPPQ